jgi:hypothetical protein
MSKLQLSTFDKIESKLFDIIYVCDILIKRHVRCSGKIGQPAWFYLLFSLFVVRPILLQ